MKQPELSPYMMARKPSGIRLGQIKFLERKNPPILVNGSIGNVMRPMHPAMQRPCNRRCIHGHGNYHAWRMWWCW